MHEKERNVVKCHSHCCIFVARVKCIYQLGKENKHNIAYVCNTCVASSALVLMLMLVLWCYMHVYNIWFVLMNEFKWVPHILNMCAYVFWHASIGWLCVCFFHVLLRFFSVIFFEFNFFSRRFIWCLCQLFRVVGICGLGCMLKLCLFVISLTFIGVHK